MDGRFIVGFLIGWFIGLSIALAFENIWLMLLCIFSPVIVLAAAEGNPNQWGDGDY